MGFFVVVMLVGFLGVVESVICITEDFVKTFSTISLTCFVLKITSMPWGVESDGFVRGS